mmetsp:Transcript_122916/g.244490  ORF Transcript_122916/g.244490 Transcript_122916/m.244490 type:complete len:222 (+) Transcript_122916:468-1133(+)
MLAIPSRACKHCFITSRRAKQGHMARSIASVATCIVQTKTTIGRCQRFLCSSRNSPSTLVRRSFSTRSAMSSSWRAAWISSSTHAMLYFVTHSRTSVHFPPWSSLAHNMHALASESKNKPSAVTLSSHQRVNVVRTKNSKIKGTSLWVLFVISLTSVNSVRARACRSPRAAAFPIRVTAVVITAKKSNRQVLRKATESMENTVPFENIVIKALHLTSLLMS